LTIHLFTNSRKLAATKYTHHGPKQNTKNGEERRERHRRETQRNRRERGRERLERALERSSALSTFRSEAGGGDEYSALAEWRVTDPETPILCQRVCGNVTFMAGMAMRNCRGN
jgi:hypothetical protein